MDHVCSDDIRGRHLGGRHAVATASGSGLVDLASVLEFWRMAGETEEKTVTDLDKQVADINADAMADQWSEL